MSHIIQSTTPSAFKRLFGFLGALAARWKAEMMYRQTYDALARLSDRELKDIGISRGDIRRLSIEAADVIR